MPAGAERRADRGGMTGGTVALLTIAGESDAMGVSISEEVSCRRSALCRHGHLKENFLAGSDGNVVIKGEK